MSVMTLPMYDFSISGEIGTVAAKNYVSIFNPANSTRVLIIGGIFTSSIGTAADTEPRTLRGFRITAASGGTLQPVSAIAKFNTRAHPNPIAEVRTDNPTVTLGAAILNHPAPIDKRAGSVNATLGFPSSPFLFYPGEGFVMRMDVGVTTLFSNISIVWAESGAA